MPPWRSGDPDGTGRGGEGAFEREFKDEFHSALKHDARGVLAMANSGQWTLTQWTHADKTAGSGTDEAGLSF